MIGLTAGLVIEGHTGKSILVQVKLHPDFLCSCSFCLLSDFIEIFSLQLADYWSAIVNFFML